MIYGSHKEFSLDLKAIESVCLSCSREFYDNASSGNYKFGDMKLAYDWYICSILGQELAEPCIL
jgi:neuroblastoma-amplified sequence